MIGWQVRAHVTGDDAWSVEFTGSEERVLRLTDGVRLARDLHETSPDDAMLLLECESRRRLDEHESRNLSIRKLHL